MKARLSVDIIAPDEELAKTGECYGTVTRDFEIPFAPPVGLKLMVKSNVWGNDPRKPRFRELFNTISNNLPVFEVSTIYWHIDDEVLHIQTSVFEPTLEQFHSCIEFLTEFYGFSDFHNQPAPD